MIRAQLSNTFLEREYRDLDARLRRGKLQAAPAFTADAYDPAAVRAVAHGWRKRMANEYESTTVFSAVAGQLVDAEAPLDATAVMLRMAQDELRHTELCAQVAEAMGVPARVNRDVAQARIASHTNVSRREAALRNVLFTTCISEMFSVAYLTASLERCEDPFLRFATRQLLADEVLHGRFGFAYLEAERHALEEDEMTRRSLEGYLRFVFAYAEQDFTGRRGFPRTTPAEEKLGAVSDEEVGDLYRATMAHAVVPAFEACGLRASEAFERRSHRIGPP